MSGLSVKYFIYQCDCESLQLYTEYVGFIKTLHMQSLSLNRFL
jgi:hypothetical protein